MAFSFALTKTHARDFVLTRTHSFARLSKYLRGLILFLCRLSAFSVSRLFARLRKQLRRLLLFAHGLGPFWLQLCYFVSLALLGSLALTLLKPSDDGFSPRYVDMLFLSTSAVTVTGLVTVEMESLSSSQIVVLTLLMLFGGEVFVSLLGLFFRRAVLDDKPAAEISDKPAAEVDSFSTIELGSVDPPPAVEEIESRVNDAMEDNKQNSTRCLSFVILSYHLMMHTCGSLLVFLYMSTVSSAKTVLRRKGMNVFLFSLSATVSSFANGGLIPTNENMAIFNKNPGLYWLVMTLVLAGNTLFPLFLRLVIWSLKKVTGAEEFSYLLKNNEEVRYRYLLPGLQTGLLSSTVLGLMAALVVMFCSMDWNSAVFDGLSPYQKLVSALFMAVNSRHAGENSIDCSLISPAVLVFTIVMMYLPSAAYFSPIQKDDTNSEGSEKEKNKKRTLVQNLILSQLFYIVIFTMAICITERRQLSRDPLNFSTFNIIFEVTSAYGNVGLSTGYSCSRLQKLNPNANCNDKSYGFSGWWNDEGKLILILLMLYGRLKQFSAKGGKAWKLI